jgi:DNA-binding response OmpR family regulator
MAGHPYCYVGLLAEVRPEVHLARVLIVDDEENQVRALTIGLRLEGFEVGVARDAEGALHVLQVEPADIAILDLMMPGTNGMELARKMRDLYPDVRVVLTSAYHLSERQLTRADCGVVGFVPKPYVLSELAEFLRQKLVCSLRPSAIAESGARLRAYP